MGKIDTWAVRITQKGKSLKHIGSFTSEEEAAEVADYWNLKIINKKELINFPQKIDDYLSGEFNVPNTYLQKRRKTLYQNIFCKKDGDRLYYSVRIQKGDKRHSESFTNKEKAIQRRDELRELYGYPKALDI